MTTPRVTVVIPTFNRAELLRQAVDSVLSQSLEDFELFIADNGSTDGTPDYVRSIGDARVHHDRLPNNIGKFGNFARCMRMGAAPFIVLLQDDDLMLRDNLAKKVAVLEANPHAVMAHSAFCNIDAGGGVLTERASWMRRSPDLVEDGPTFLRRSMIDNCRADMSAALMRRDLLGDETFRESDGEPCDFGLWLRLALRGDVAYLAEPLVARRVHDSSGSAGLGGFVVSNADYAPTLDAVADVQHVKRTFLEEFGSDLPNVKELRKLSRGSGRRYLCRVVADTTGADRRARETIGLVWRAARIEPTVLCDSEAIRLVVGALAPRVRQLARRARAGTI